MTAWAAVAAVLALGCEPTSWPSAEFGNAFQNRSVADSAFKGYDRPVSVSQLENKSCLSNSLVEIAKPRTLIRDQRDAAQVIRSVRAGLSRLGIERSDTRIHFGDFDGIHGRLVLVSANNDQPPSEESQNQREDCGGSSGSRHNPIGPSRWAVIKMFGGLFGGAAIWGAGLFVTFGDGSSRVGRWRRLAGGAVIFAGLSIMAYGWLWTIWTRGA